MDNGRDIMVIIEIDSRLTSKLIGLLLCKISWETKGLSLVNMLESIFGSILMYRSFCQQMFLMSKGLVK